MLHAKGATSLFALSLHARARLDSDSAWCSLRALGIYYVYMSSDDDEYSDHAEVFRGVLPLPPKNARDDVGAQGNNESSAADFLYRGRPTGPPPLPLADQDEEAAQMAALGLPTSLRNGTADVNGDRYFTVAVDPAKRAAASMTLDDAETGRASVSRAKRPKNRDGSAPEQASQEVTAPPGGDSRRPVIRLMNDYSCDLPLWGDLDGVQLSHRLEKDLRSLARRFNAHFDHQSGWDSEERAARHREHATSLHRRLQSALPGRDVELDLWEAPLATSGGAAEEAETRAREVL